MQKFLFLLAVFTCSLLCAKQVKMTYADFEKSLNEIFKNHACYDHLNQELIKRTCNYFLEELDPKKMYFTQKLQSKWKALSQNTLEKVLYQLHQGEFPLFEQMYEDFVKAVQEREKIPTEAPIQKPDISIKKLETWAEDSLMLQKKWLYVRYLQKQAAAKIYPQEPQEQAYFLQKMEKREKEREQSFLKTTKEEKTSWILIHLLKSICRSMDSYTTFLTPEETRLFRIHLQQKLCGIGVELREHLMGIRVERILEKGPAGKQKQLKVHDMIIAVDQVPIVGLDLTEAVEKIRGEKGSCVQLTILRKNKENKPLKKLDIELTRDDIVLDKNRFSATLEPFGSTYFSHIALHSFYADENSSSSLDLEKTLQEHRKKGTKGVLLDLRGNAGGGLEEAVRVAGLFLKPGIVVSIKDQKKKLYHLRTTRQTPVWEGPLLILVDKASASASEIVAQSLQDYGRAIVLGDSHTFGKGSFQTFTLNSASSSSINEQNSYKITRGLYYTVSGKSPQLKGVQPDITIPGLLSFIDMGEKHVKYPLASQDIPAQFEDCLSDLPFFQKLEMQTLYQKSKQTKNNLYTSFLPLLQKNTQKRTAYLQNWLKALETLKEQEESGDFFPLYVDVQLIEAKNTLKDLLCLIQQPPVLQKAS